MLRDDSNKPFWKEKFIDGLPNLFAHKIRTVLSNSNGIIDYDTLTYGDIISTIKQEGLKMCIEQHIAKQQYDNKRKAKYEMGNFCEQYGILSIAPSQRKYIKHKKEKYHKQGRIWKKKKNFQPNEYYNKNKRFSKKYNNKKFDKKKTKFSRTWGITKLLSKSLQQMYCQSLPDTSTAIASPKNYYYFFKSKANSKINFLVSHHQRKNSWLAMMRFQDHFQKENSPLMMMFQDFFQCMHLKTLSKDSFFCILCLYIWLLIVLYLELLSTTSSYNIQAFIC